jgi:hypothetical protein
VTGEPDRFKRLGITSGIIGMPVGELTSPGTESLGVL